MSDPHGHQVSEELLARFIARELKPQVRDIFSYHSRTTKELLRRVLALGEHMAQSTQVQNDALSIEVWCACAAPVFQGYWRSSIPEAKKKAVLDACDDLMLNIMINDVAIPSEAFVGLTEEEQHEILAHSRREFSQLLRLRSEQYVEAIVRHLNFETAGPDPFAGELVNILIQNLFGSDDDSAIDRAEMSTLLALPMILAFHEAMRR